MYENKGYLLPPRAVNRLLWFTGIIMVASLTTMGITIALLAGGYGTVQTMNVMRDGMGDMNSKMSQGTDAVAGVVAQLKSKFPANQLEVSTRQVLGTLENGNKISARFNHLLQHVDENAIRSINGIVASFTPQDVDALKTHALGTLAKINQIVADIDSAKVAALIETFGGLDAKQINALIGVIAKLHEIKINF
jgi:uncharacterized protein YoxC